MEPPINELGLDISRHQGEQIDWQAMVASGVRFVYLKASQGIAHKDPRFEANFANAKSVGLLVGAYHFTTTDGAYKQYEWFVKCMGDKVYDLPPAPDCEYYNSYGEPFLGLRYDEPDPHLLAAMGAFGAIPPEDIVDSMGRMLTTWMAERPTIAGYKYPTIYTNLASGNAIFKTASMKRYNLWIAHWHGPTVPLTKPSLPKVWKGEPWFIWQDGIVDGSQYGITGAQVDHDLWGNKFPFPGSPPPVNKYWLDATGRAKDGTIVSGRLEVT